MKVLKLPPGSGDGICTNVEAVTVPAIRPPPLVSFVTWIKLAVEGVIPSVDTYTLPEASTAIPGRFPPVEGVAIGLDQVWPPLVDRVKTVVKIPLNTRSNATYTFPSLGPPVVSTVTQGLSSEKLPGMSVVPK